MDRSLKLISLGKRRVRNIGAGDEFDRPFAVNAALGNKKLPEVEIANQTAA